VPDPSSDERSPGRAVLAAALSVVALVVLTTLTRTGGWALLLAPLLLVWVATVYLGAPLNAPIEFRRLRRLRP
jgi:hypothetical protein